MLFVCFIRKTLSTESTADENEEDTLCKTHSGTTDLDPEVFATAKCLPV
uniref:Bm11056, isoform b n=1 Tax=Brugia malayi TaxID=6279 RepID=A0A1I9G550_BRUMA|nr:Bm11056, isoform b [Brugia malayi]